MNIGIVTAWYESGAGYVSLQYAAAFAQARHTVHIFGRRGYNDATYTTTDIAGVTWARPAKYPKGYEFDIRHFKSWLKEKDIDAVLFNEQSWILPIEVARECGIRTLGYIDYYTKDNIYNYGSYDTLLCNTRRHFEAFKWHKDVHYIPWGTDVDKFTVRPRPHQRDSEFVFFHSCGETPYRKGTDLLIEAFSELESDSRLVIHSRVNLENAFPALAGQIRKMLLDGRMTLIVGTVPAPGLYHLGDVYVYPTRLEGIGLTISEALACGMPVITTDNPPMNEFINDSCGSLVRVETFVPRSDGYYWDQSIASVSDLRDKLELWTSRSGNIDEWREAAREHAIRCMNWANNIDTISPIIEITPSEITVADKRCSHSDSGTMTAAQILLNQLYRIYRKVRNVVLKRNKHPREEVRIYGKNVFWLQGQPRRNRLKLKIP
jgi:glycosyltransferase involved in cell wall biosynthesis